MKEIILDTDIGVDCDDAIALLLLINSIKKNQCKCDTIVTSTTRIGAVASIKAISRSCRKSCSKAKRERATRFARGY